MSEIICPHCGASNPPDAIECRKCHRFLFESSPSSAFPFSGEDDDWLKSLREDTEPPPEAGGEEPKPSEAAPFEEEVPDWLARIRQRSQEELGREEGLSTEGMEEEDLPDWLKDVEIAPGESEKSAPETAGEEELPLPDWLSLVSSEEESQTPPLQTTPPFQTGEEELEISEEALPDWLKGIEQPEETLGEPPTSPAEEAPDWLAASSLFIEEEKEQISPPGPEEEPDWLKSFETFGTEPSPLTGEEQAAHEAGEDWLKAFETFESAPEPSPVESEPEAALPEQTWLGSIEELPAEPASQETEGQPEELPAEEFARIPPLSENPPFDLPEEEWLGTFPPVEESLSSLEGEAPIIPAGEQPQEVEDLTSMELEDFSALAEGASAAFTFETPPAESAAEEELEISPFISEELPEWFDEQVFEPSAETTSPAGESEAGLEPAELPGWLEAMRPIEAVAPGRIGTDEDQRIETSGPLSGFQGILPAEAIITQYSKPSIYSARLQVNEKQRTYANLLEAILQEEKQGRPSTGVKGAVPTIFGRMLLGILLAAAILFVLIGGVNIATPPTLFAPENVAFFSQIQSLSTSSEQNTPILVAIDFEPALAGELSTVTLPVMEDLLQSGKSLAIVSINPAGAILAEELLIGSAAEGQILNLGYLPGGVTSIAALASQPALAAPYDRTGAYAWNQPPFQSVQKISDFAAILLLTDNTDTSRLWIEQLSPLLDNTPLLVIASNQAAPMIQPYLQNGQAAGMLAGLPGLAAYQQLSGRPANLSSAYLNAYQAGLMLIVVLILLFSLYYLVAQLFKKPEAKGK